MGLLADTSKGVRIYEERNYQRATLSTWVGSLIGVLFRKAFLLPFKVWRSSLYLLGALVLSLFAVSAMGDFGGVLAGVLFLLPIVLLFIPQARRFSPFAGDFGAVRRRKKKKAGRLAANELIYAMGFNADYRPDDEDTWLSAYILEDANGGVFGVEHIRGVPDRVLFEKVKAEKHLLDAVRLGEMGKLGKGAVEIPFYTDDPLVAGEVLTAPKKFNHDAGAIEVGRDAYDEPARLVFGDHSGMLVSGLPGMGKTGSLASFMSSLAVDEQIDLKIIDCKAGDDWTSFQPLVAQFLRPDTMRMDGLEAVRDVLAAQERAMFDRIQSNKELFGESNFWNVPVAEREAKGVRLMVLLIDEAQDILGKNVGEALGKEGKQVATEIKQLVEALVKKGRSAGMLTVITTQKVDAEAVPTAIRDVCGIRVALWLSNSTMSQVALGGLAQTDDASVVLPHQMPRQKGRAVITDEEGGLAEIVFAFFPEKELRKTLAAEAEGRGGEANE